MPFSPETLAVALHTTRFGRAVQYLEETDSTIRAAWRWLDEGGPEGAVVIAGRQHRGQGRRGRTWSSPSGGLWMSVLARPLLRVAQAGRLGMAMALSAAEGLEAVAGVSVGLKWPNDILLDGRKLAGVLVETRVEGDRVSAAVLSAGINVNVDLAALPEGVRAAATSLREATGAECSLERLAARTLDALERLWPAVTNGGEGLVTAWHARDLLRGTQVHVVAGSAHLDGVCHGVDPDGALLLTVAGEVQRVTAGEIDHLRPMA